MDSEKAGIGAARQGAEKSVWRSIVVRDRHDTQIAIFSGFCISF
ncbi:MAG: hypothetical protein PHX60_13125 [Giesbergeria sp.]|nr:hypothetical protein [Giesbergeria sp.]MDD2610603.1 hypothetical protein [Giesbergeria sp.]